MRVALFGSTGFVGSYLVDALIAAGMHPVLLVRPGSEHKVGQMKSCTIVSADIGEREAIDRALDGADGAIYNIGILREFEQHGISFDALHFTGAKRVMDAAGAAGVKRFLLMSANGVKAEGTPYQRTKYQGEQYLATTALDWTVFRPSVLFGDPHGRQEFATQLLNDIINSPLPAPLFYAGLLPIDAGGFRLSPVHVEDVARAFVSALQDPRTIGRILPLGGPEALTWREILKRIAAAVGKRKLMVPAPAWGTEATVAMLERFPVFPISRDQLHMLMEGNTCSADSFALLDIDPRPFDAASLSYLAGAQTPSPRQAKNAREYPKRFADCSPSADRTSRSAHRRSRDESNPMLGERARATCATRRSLWPRVGRLRSRMTIAASKILALCAVPCACACRETETACRH